MALLHYCPVFYYDNILYYSMLQRDFHFNKLATAVISRNTNTTNDVIFDVIKPNDTINITFPLNVVQHNFLYKPVRMEVEYNNFRALFLSNAWYTYRSNAL